MDRATFFDQYGAQNKTGDTFLSYLPDEFVVLDNHLSGSYQKRLVVQMDTGCYLGFHQKEGTKSEIHFLDTNQKKHPETQDLDHSYNEVIRKAQEILGKKSGVELNYISDSLPHPSDHEQWIQLNQHFLNNTPDKKPATKKLLYQSGNQEQGISIPRNTGFSLVYAHLRCRLPKLKSILQERDQELNEVLETINQFFELPSLSDLTGDDQEWLDKLIEDSRLKSRLRHVVNQNTALEIAVDQLQKGKIDVLGNLMNNVHDSTVLDFELNCAQADRVIQNALNTEIVLGSCAILHENSFDSLHLIKSEDIDAFRAWVRKMGPEETIPTIKVLC